MIILGIDTSSKAASCALMRDALLLGESFLNTGLTHSETILPMVKALLATARCTIDEVDAFAVSTGPGSFTGLRIGIAAVKGLAMGTGKPCIPVSTLEGLAYTHTAFAGYVAPVMDARRKQVYTALFKADFDETVRVEDDAAISLDDLAVRLAALAPTPVLLTGDGTELTYAFLRKLDGMSHIRCAPEAFRHQRAGSVCMAAQRFVNTDTFISPAELAPVYLRLPQAERELLEKQKGAAI